jgi:lysylphosphatidylglycerol synthetase-like protein (DUF2156 family)
MTTVGKSPESPAAHTLHQYLRMHGSGAFAYATLQSGLDYFIEEGVGYIAYASVRHPVLAPRGRKIALGDPICAPRDCARLIEQFIRGDQKAVFVPVSETCGKSLQSLGFKVNCVGYEPEIRIQEYNTRGNWKELDLIRRARNEAKRNGIVIREEPQLDRVQKSGLEEVSKNWLGGKTVNDREVWMYSRPPVFQNEQDVRKFVAHKGDQIAGFSFYDPIYSNGETIGYSANTSRCDETRFGKLSVAINMVAIDQFKKEGKKVLNLCIAPFHAVQEGKMNDDLLTKAFIGFMYNYGNGVYNFQGLSSHKAKYRAHHKPVYFASNSLIPVNDVYLAFKACDMVRSYPEILAKMLCYALKRAGLDRSIHSWKTLRRFKQTAVETVSVELSGSPNS